MLGDGHDLMFIRKEGKVRDVTLRNSVAKTYTQVLLTLVLSSLLDVNPSCPVPGNLGASLLASACILQWPYRKAQQSSFLVVTFSFV